MDIRGSCPLHSTRLGQTVLSTVLAEVSVLPKNVLPSRTQWCTTVAKRVSELQSKKFLVKISYKQGSETHNVAIRVVVETGFLYY